MASQQGVGAQWHRHDHGPRYALRWSYARKFNVRNSYVANAINRLAYYTDIIGDAKMRDYVTGTTDPNDPSKHLDYTDEMFVQQRPGMTAEPPVVANQQFAPVAP